MECESMLFVVNHLRLSLGISSSFPNGFFDFKNYEVRKERNVNIHIRNGGSQETLNLIQIICGMMQNKKLSTEWKSS